MEILAHRGWWNTREEQNKIIALRRALDAGYGLETDIRYCNSELVISHDHPKTSDDDLVTFDDLLNLAEAVKSSSCIALNIKEDGLAPMLKDALDARDFTNYFCFDMSIPDTRSYIDNDLFFKVRLSEVEVYPPPWLDESVGVWLDCFYGEWFDSALLRALFTQGKQVSIVSPELHSRDYNGLWEQLRGCNLPADLVALCTDFPDSAKSYFESK